MARVFTLHHDRLHHRPSDTRFEPVQVPNEDGRPVVRGLAIVSDEVAREHFARLPEVFKIEYADTPAAERTPTQAAAQPMLAIVPPAEPAAPIEPEAPAKDAERPRGRRGATPAQTTTEPPAA